MKKLSIALALLIGLSSCQEKDDKSYLDIDLTCSQSTQSAYKNVSFMLNKMILHKYENGKSTTYALPNSKKDVYFNIENPEGVYVNNWDFDQFKIKHIELDISEMTLKKESNYITYKIPENWRCIYENVDLNLEPSTTHIVSIGLDLRKTVTLDSANQLWIKPVFASNYGL